MKKYILTFTALFFAGNFYSQNVKDLGKKNFQEVKNMNNWNPCEITPDEALTYCSTDGSSITYLFVKGILNGIMFRTAFLTKNQAENELEKQVNEFKNRNGMQPLYGNGAVIFKKPSYPLSVSYAIKEYSGTYYLIYYTFLFLE